MLKHCEKCGMLFVVKNKTQRYCSHRCSPGYERKTKMEDKVEYKVMEVSNTLELPRKYHSYGGGTNLDKLFAHYKTTYGVEPSVMYRFKRRGVNFIAIEINGEE